MEMSMAVASGTAALDPKAFKVVLYCLALGAYLLIPFHVRRKANVWLFRKVRGLLAHSFGWKTLSRLDENACTTGPGWRLLPLIFTFFMFVVLISQIIEGRYALALNVSVAVVAYTVALFAFPKKYLVIVGRFSLIHQLLAISVLSNKYMGTMGMKRATFTRALTCVSIFDDLGEAFLHMGSMSLVLFDDAGGWDSADGLIPLQLFMRFLFPMYLIGMREFICSQRSFSLSRPEGKKMFFVIGVVPSIAIVFAFYSATVSRDGRLTAGKYLGMFLLSISMLCAARGNVLDSIVADPVEWKLTWEMLDGRPGFISERQVLLLLSSGVFIACSPPVFGLIGTVIVALIYYWLKEEFRSHASIIVHAVASLVPLAYPSENQAIYLVLMSTVRVALCFERRPLSLIVRDVALLSGSMMVSLVDESLVSILGLLAFTCVVMAFIIAKSRLHAGRMFAREAQGQAFLAHALKQKFSAVGGALEDVLNDKRCITIWTKEEDILLRHSLHECRQGERLCHVVNVSGNIRKDIYAGEKVSRDLGSQLESLVGAEALLTDSPLEFVNDWNKQFSHAIELDWDLFKLVLCTWAFKARTLKVSMTKIRHDKYEIRFERHGVNKRYLVRLLESAFATSLQLLHGRFEGENTLLLTCPVKKRKFHSSNEEAVAPPACKPSLTLPEGLIVAILDDNALVRRNVERACEVYFRVNKEKSFSLGESVGDCKKCVDWIIERNVDIVLLDENLDFEDEIHVSGANIAQEIRNRGFKGCLLLHSAMSSGRDLHPAFDAFVEKTGSRARLCEDISRVYLNHTMKASSDHGNPSIT